MEKVLGIGGFFFRAANPEQLTKWYNDNLGITPPGSDAETKPWEQDAGTTAFTPFAKDTDYFGKPEQQWMINFRVGNLDAMVAQLRAAGTEVEVNAEVYSFGRFARLKDPEGNPIELWQPA